MSATNNVKNMRYLNHSGKESEKGCMYTLRYAHTHTYKRITAEHH